ncbi:MAG: hypothetical protein HY903_12600 [Deltaproteobacteria bacterium]|nr:hypothetical protein [Deltaproteobacteria bacterium]
MVQRSKLLGALVQPKGGGVPSGGQAMAPAATTHAVGGAKDAPAVMRRADPMVDLERGSDRYGVRNPAKAREFAERDGAATHQTRARIDQAKRELKKLTPLVGQAASAEPRVCGPGVIKLAWLLASVGPDDLDAPTRADVQRGLDRFLSAVLARVPAGQSIAIDVPRDGVTSLRAAHNRQVNVFDTDGFARGFEFLINEAPAKFGLEERHHAEAKVATVEEDLRHGLGTDDVQRVVIAMKS